MPQEKKILIAIIAYNEELSIAKTIDDLLAHKSSLGYDIVVIDNGSSDNTKEIAKSKGVNVLYHPVNTGGSMGTVRGYFMYAYRNGYDVLCQFDGDGQHLASELFKIVNPILHNEADYIIGSRFIDKIGFQSYFLRRLGITIFAKLDSLLIGMKLTDATSGFRAYSRKVMQFYSKYYPHELFDTNQLMILAHYAGCKIKEVPVVMKAREHGESEYNFTTAFVFPFKGLVNILGCYLQKSQIERIAKKLGATS
jgi:hypothetical protein